MGISASLIKFNKSGEEVLENLDFPEVSLTSFLPMALHHLIFKKTIEIYDMEFYRKKYNDPDLYICVLRNGGSIVLSNKQEEKEPKTLEVECEAIHYDNIRYIGGSEVFKKNIFKIYNAKKRFPYLFNISEKELIVSNKSLLKELNQIKEDVEYYYIDLGY